MKHSFTDIHGVTHTWETPDAPVPLEGVAVLATLLAVAGVVSVEDAANSVGLAPQDLINEAQAWAVAGGNNGD